MKTDELRERYLRFFERHGHTIHPSDSLIPENDPSLLFTGAGMNQFKDMFLGKGNLPFKRATTAQKCLRTGDVERVGRTARHHTFFEMMGNFSFGDYFKAEAIPWAWEFVTKELKVPPDRLYVSVYKDDQEAFDIWEKKVGVAASRLSRLGEHDNFWPADAPSQGPNGPCGPCSEIYFDQGPSFSCGAPDCAVGCDCDRYVEFWNLVFTQFDRQKDGSLPPLPQKNIDTGLGLERCAALLQGAPSNFDIDLFAPLKAELEEILHVKYDLSHAERTARMRRILDHVRAVGFCIMDGALPSNEGRGYVVRKILRLAVRDGMALGCREPFLHRLIPTVGSVMKRPYPDLAKRSDTISRYVEAEEHRFLETLEQGDALLKKAVADARAANLTTFPGEEAFRLYDTYGIPLDMIEPFLAENRLALDRAGFDRAKRIQEETSRAGTAISRDIFSGGQIGQVKGSVPVTTFLGYEKAHSPAGILAILKGNRAIETAFEGDEVTVLLDQTPFYGESGGQQGDTGRFTAPGAEAEIIDTKRVEDYILHVAKVRKGSLKVGQNIEAAIDAARRSSLARSHSATHVLQAALRTILGSHVEQAGSLVAPDRLRFDFSHFAALSPEEVAKVEQYVNDRVCENAPKHVEELPLAEAKASGAISFFGEKYGAKVRVVTFGDFSKELCGGTHLSRVGSIGYFRITQETSIGSGIRRIEAVTGPEAVRRAGQTTALAGRAAASLNIPPERLPDRVGELLEEIKSLRAEIAKKKAEEARASAKSLADKAETVNGVKVVVARLDGMSMEDLLACSDPIKKMKEPYVCALGSAVEGKVNLLVCVAKTLVEKGLDAGALVREAAKTCGGGGGGRKDQAQAGGKDATKLDEALGQLKKTALAKLGMTS
ncbi:MAG: alanine--tRNA ligase [Planctomycetes bacterium]|nr:alanine--tRNA ligase [Planctomycetota bacterium]